MRLGILGTGMIVQAALPVLAKQNIEKMVILGTERSRERTEGLKEKYHLAAAYYNYEELLADDIDTVYVALPNHLHYEFARKALLAGKHLIMEKPITVNTAELKDLMELAEMKKLMILEAVTVHYFPAFLAIKEDVKKLGEIRIVNFNYSQYSSRYDAFKEGKILPVFDYHKAGGALMDINVYNINAIMGLFGIPKKVTYHPNIARGIDTSGILHMEYEDFQAVSIGAKDCAAPNCCTIQGDQGMIVTDMALSSLNAYEFTEYGKEPEKKIFEPEQNRMHYEFEEFIKIIDGGDYERQQQMLTLSYEIAKVMEQARKESGIRFDNDETVPGTRNIL